MREIDEKIVAMKFDNKQFESATKQSMQTLTALKKNLNMADSTKTFNALDKAARNISLEGIAAGVEALQKRFSTLGIVSMQVIQNMTNSLIQFATKGVGFVTDAIKSGGIKRAMNLENAHFQLQALLKDEEKVQEVMVNANTAVDGTAYSLDEAAKAASQFAASGIQAGDQMVNSLRGIVGVSAMTNSQFEDISRIFTTVAGNGRLMGDQLLQLSGRGLNAAATIADFFNGVNNGSKEASEGVKAAIQELTGGLEVTEGTIREFVTDGEISFSIFSEAMTEAFADSAERANETFTGSISNMKSALARIGAGFISPLVAQNSEIVKLFNSLRVRINDVKKALVFDEELGNVHALSKQVTDAILNMASSASKWVDNVDLSKPLMIFYNGVESIKNVAKGFGQVLKTITVPFNNVFGDKKTIDILSNMSIKIEEITSKFTLSSKTAANLRLLFRGVFDVVRLLIDGFKALLKALSPIRKPLKEIATRLIELSGTLGINLSKFTEWVRNSPQIAKGYEIVSNAIGYASAKVKDFIAHIEEYVSKIKNLMPGANKNMEDSSESVKKLGDGFSLLSKRSEMMDNAMKMMSSFSTSVKNFSKSLMNAVPQLLENIKSFVGLKDIHSVFDLLDHLMKLINTGLLGGLIGSITGLTKTLKGSVKSVTGFLNSIKSVLNGVRGVLVAYQTSIKADVLKKIAIAVAILAGSIFVLGSIDPVQLAASLGAMTAAMGDLMGSITIMTKLTDGKKIVGMERIGSALIKLAASVLILSFALKKISSIDPDRLLDSVLAITILIGEMTAVAYALSHNEKKMKAGATSMIGFAAAIYILASSVRKLGELDTDILIKGLLSVAGLLAELALFMTAMNYGKISLKQAVGIIAVAAALKILEDVVTTLGMTDTNILIVGITAIAGLLSEIAAFSTASGYAKHILSTSISLVIMAKALEMLEGPISDFGNMSIEQIGKGLITMAAGLGIITAAMHLVPKKSFMISLSFIDMAQALKTIAGVMVDMAKLSWEEIGKGLTVMGAALAEIVIALNLSKTAMSGSGGIVIMSIAITILASALEKLGSMSLESIIKSLIALGGAFTIIGIAGALIGPLAPAIISLSASFALLSVGISLLGTGMFLLSIGFATLAESGLAGVENLVAIVQVLIYGTLDTITGAADKFREAAITVVLSICDVLLTCVPKIVEVVLAIVQQVITSLADHAPAIVSELLRFLIGVIDVLAENIPELVHSIMNFIGKLISSVLNELANVDTTAIRENLETIGLVAGLMYLCAGLMSILPSAMAGVLAVGAVIVELTAVLAAIGGLAQIPGLTWLVEEGGELLEAVGSAIGKFVGGIIGGVMEGVTSALPQIGTDLSMFMENVTPFIDGASNIKPGMLDGVTSLAKVILILTAAELLDGLTSWFTGGTSLEEFGQEIAAFAPHFVDFASQVENVKPGVIQAAANAALALAEMASKLPNSGGLAAKIMGDNKLSDFGKEIEAFGPYLAGFAEDVKDVKPDVVTSAASCASVLAEMASKLPNSGGLAAKIMGDNKLSDFGKEIADFAPHLADFADKVKDVKPSVVKAATTAAQTLSELADGLPNQGGLVSWFTGDNTLSDFGENLASFGPHLAAFADSIKDVNPSTLTASASAAEMLVELSNGLENSGGFVSFWTGDNTLDDFGEQLVILGEGLSSYYEEIKSINTKVMGNVTKELAELGKTVQKLPTSNQLTKFTEDMRGAGTDAVNKFMDAFKGSNLMLATTVNGWALGLSSAFKKYLDLNLFKTRGKEVIDAFVNGFKGQQITSTAAMIMICKNITNAFQNNLKTNDFKAMGNNALIALNSGITLGKNTVVSNATAIGKAIVNGIKTEIQNGNFSSIGSTIVTAISSAMTNNKYKISDVARQIRNDIYNAFKDLGEYAAEGLAKGLNGKQNVVSNAATAIAQIATNAAKNNLQVKSPSRIWMAIGGFLSEGLSIGILDKMRMVAQAGEKIADTATDPIALAVDTINNLMQEDLGENLTLTPVLDLSQVQSGVSELTKMLNVGTGLSATYERTMNAASSFSKQRAAKLAQEESDEVDNETSGPTFIQNNYSPKALSRIDIYRQTQSQFRMFERMVKQT